MEDAPLKTLAELWRREYDATRRRFAEEREATSLDERVARGLALADLSLDETGAAPGDRTLLWLSPSDTRQLDDLRAGPGTPVVLWWEAPEDPSSVQGVVARRRGAKLGVMVDGSPPERLSEGSFHLDQEAPQTTFRRGERALAAFADAARKSDLGRLRQVLFERAEPDLGQPGELDFLDDALNPPQREAVRGALAALDLALVHGPPGTGKTRTLVEVVRQAVRRGERVLVTAASNAAVDNLSERLIEAGVELIRIGHPARVAPAVEARTLDTLLEATPDYALTRRWTDEANAIRRRIDARSGRGNMGRAERRQMYAEARRLMGDARGHLRRIQRAIVARTPVIAATAAGADTSLLDEETFDLVVLDEATQAPDPIAMVALLRAPKVVMAGDPHQLPPTVIDPQAEREGLGTTFFERLAARATLLTVQHRMHSRLMAFPSRSKYEDRLEAAPHVAEHALDELPGVSPDPLRPGPLVFVDTAGKGWDETREADDPSVRNPDQAERTAAEVRRLLSRGLSPTDVAVITPYYAQVRLLREALAGVEGLEIGTVDGFQGREKEAVVLDLVRSNPEGELGFLNDTRRMNVALTRARRFLLVIGDSATLGGHPYYAEFLSSVERDGAWVSAWSDEAEELPR